MRLADHSEPGYLHVKGAILAGTRSTDPHWWSGQKGIRCQGGKPDLCLLPGPMNPKNVKFLMSLSSLP
jgi:hypothetical protein